MPSPVSLQQFHPPLVEWVNSTLKSNMCLFNAMVYRYDIESRKTKKSLAIITLIFVLEKSKNAGTVETLVFEKEKSNKHVQ